MYDLIASFREQRRERFLEVDVLAGADWHGRGVLELPVLIGVLPGDLVLEPGGDVFLNPPREPDAVLQRDMADMVDGRRGPRARSRPRTRRRPVAHVRRTA